MRRIRITAKRVVSCILVTLPPILAIVLGCFFLYADTLINLAFVTTFVIIPVIFIGLQFLIIFFGEKLIRKILLSIFVFFVFFISFVASYMVGTFEQLAYTKNTDVEESYIHVCEDFDLMPALDEVGNYTQVEHYDYFSQTFLIFTCDADTLIFSYGDAEYQIQKARLEETYVFQEQPVTAYTYTCNPYAEIQGYSFRLLKVEDAYDGEIDYPSKIILIATNDQNHSIAYTAFYDDDIDIIESFESFVMEDCGWKHIVK